MLRFYNGLTPELIDEMSVIEFDQYWLSITKIEAQEMLIDLTIADYPHLTPPRRKELYNKLKKDGIKAILTREPGGTKIAEKHIKVIALPLTNFWLLNRKD